MELQFQAHVSSIPTAYPRGIIVIRNFTTSRQLNLSMGEGKLFFFFVATADQQLIAIIFFIFISYRFLESTRCGRKIHTRRHLAKKTLLSAIAGLKREQVWKRRMWYCTVWIQVGGFFLLNLGDVDGDSLALGKVLAAILVTSVGEFGDEDALAVVCNQWSNTLELTTVSALDLDVSTVAVKLTVADSVVPEPLENDPVARRCVLGDLNVDRVRSTALDAAETVADDGLDDNPCLTVVVREGPLAMTTAVAGTDRVLGFDGLASSVGGGAGGASRVFAEGLILSAVNTDGRIDVIVDRLALGGSGAALEASVAWAGLAEAGVGLCRGGDGEKGQAGCSRSEDGGFEDHFCKS